MNEGEQKSIIQNMQDAGCSQETIDCFLESQEVSVLNKHRKCLLDGMHETQKKIDCLDYLIYQMKKHEK